MPTIRRVLDAAVARLAQAQIEAPHALVRRLLAHRLERSAAWLIAHDDATLEASVVAQIDDDLDALARGVPLAYVIASAGFFGRTFRVTRDVLVPRPETEELVVRALTFLRADPTRRVARVLDVGTGSGAIALTLAAEMPELSVDAVDVSEAALAVARENARALGLSARVRFAVDARFGRGLVDAARYACVVANLPYVRRGDLAPAPDPTSFEPRLALDGGEDGLDAYRGLLATLADLLAPGGAAFLEAGLGTVEPLAALARATFGARAVVRTYGDLAGRPRIVEVRSLAPRETSEASPNIDGP